MGSIFPGLKACPQHLLVPKQYTFTFKQTGDSTGAGKRKQKQSRKSGERNHPDQRTRQELSLQEWDEIKGEGIWQRLMEKTSARKTVGQKA